MYTQGNIGERNNTVDILRGIAMLLVVLGHTMTGCVTDSMDSVLFQIVWTLQMPLFMLISGYVTKYSKPIHTWRDLINHIKKRTLSYLLPWIIWTFVVRGIVFGQNEFLNLKWLFYHMDSGYWFLFSLWTISTIYTISSYVANKAKYVFSTKVTLYVIGMALLFVVGLLFDLSFLCIKLTLYYMPFYFAGYIYTEIEKRIANKTWFGKVKELIVSICFAVWIIIIVRVNVYNLDESFVGIILRISSSITGCIALIGFVTGLLTADKKSFCTPIRYLFSWVGNNSLQIYLLHGFFLNLLRINPKPVFSTPQGIVLTFGNYILTIVLVAVIVHILKANQYLQFVLFGKRWRKEQ